MKYTNKQLQTYFNTLNDIAIKVTGKLAYIVAKNAHKISDELQEYTEIRNNKLYRYGQEQDGQFVLLKDNENYPKFVSEMSEYDEIEQDISLLKINPEDLYSSDLNAIEINQLMFMINDEESL